MLAVTPIPREIAKERALLHYQTAKPCRNGHSSSRFVSTGACLACHRNRSERFRKENPEKVRAWKAKSYKNNCQKNRIYARHYHKMNRENCLLAMRRYRQDNLEKCRQRDRVSFQNNKQKKYLYRNLRYRSDPSFLLAKTCRRMVERTLKVANEAKAGRTRELLGYAANDLRSHLESKFQSGMTWENYGEWHIDHIQPISHLISIGVTDPSKINALSNLQPLWATDNWQKGSKLDYMGEAA